MHELCRGTTRRDPFTSFMAPQGDSQPQLSIRSQPLGGRNSGSKPKKSPGPGAYKPTYAIGKQVMSNKPTSPTALLGSSTRDQQNKLAMDEELAKTFCGRESPGPSGYQLAGAVGNQSSSTKPTLPQWRFSKSSRDANPYLRETAQIPGAGSYKLGNSVGKQPLSHNKNLPLTAFGTSQRDLIARNQYLSREHEKQNFGTVGPGPSTAGKYSSLGKQSTSIRATSPGWGFGKASRYKEQGHDMPGPGEYCA